MFRPQDLPTVRSRFDLDRILAVAGEVGLVPPAPNEFALGAALAGELMHHEVVGVDTLKAVQTVQPAATLVFREAGRITGVSGQLLLREAAVAHLFAGAFNSLDIDLDLLSRPGEIPAAGYAWGIAATTKLGGAAVIALGRALRAQLFPDLTIFTRAVTPVGLHIATKRYGYQPLRWPDDDLLIRPATSAALAA